MIHPNHYCHPLYGREDAHLLTHVLEPSGAAMVARPLLQIRTHMVA